MDAQNNGLPRLVQLFPTDNCQGNTTIDIIAVHGIETHSPRTWIAYEQDEEPKGRAINWLCDEDMLPKVVPEARIWAYDYNSNCYSDNAQHVDILGLGDTFLEILWKAKDKGVGKRILIFIGSCFGGVVVAQTLERASRDPTNYEYLLRSTAGVVFLGTPLRGTATASIAEWVAVIRKFLGKETSTGLLQSLKQNASSLDNLIHDFSKMAIVHKFQIRCFYETRRTQVMNAWSRQIAKWSLISEVELVPKESACLDGHTRIPLEVRHAMMNKFRNPHDVNFKLVSVNLKEIADNARISQRQNPEELKCLQCLTSNYKEDKDRNENRVPGTCEWFLKHPKFLSWRQKDTASLLWVSADPGCGKSVLSRALVDEKLLSLDIKRSFVCYFFFKDDDTSRQSGAHALSAILHQLFVQKPLLLRHAMNRYRNHGTNICTMFKELWDILNMCASDPESGEIICVLDALDECKQPAREDLVKQLSWFYSIQNKTNTKLKFIATSRPYYDIERFFYSSISDISTIRLNGEEESEKISNEIDLVINHQVPRISKNRNFPLESKVQKALMEYLKKIPHRTYLWLHLILNVIQESFDSTSIRLERLVNKLPRTVEDAYEKILMKGNDSAQARRLLHIIVAATRPLTLQEMNIALAIDDRLERGESCQSYNELDLEPAGPFRDRVRNVCGLFVSIIDSRIYLIHQTAKDFLVSKNIGHISSDALNSSSEIWRHSLNPVESNLVFVKICLSYLLFQESNRQFLNYAAENWIIHYRQARIKDDKLVLQLILDLLDTQSNQFSRWLRVCVEKSFYNLELNGKLTGLMIASWFGLEAIVTLLLKQDGIELHHKDVYGQTALSWAVAGGHAEVVKLLLEQDGIELNVEDFLGQTVLSWAAARGHVWVVKLLLEQDGIELNLKDSRGRTALSRAAAEGHTEMVKLLLEQDGVERNPQDSCGRTVLSWAAAGGHAEVVKLLLEQDGIKLNLKDFLGRTPLSWAAARGHVGIVKLLLKQDGIELSLEDFCGRTALSWAAAKGHTEMVKLLLEQDGIELHHKDDYGQTALSWAASSGCGGIVKLLLEQDGIELNSKDSRGQTALLVEWGARMVECGMN